MEQRLDIGQVVLKALLEDANFQRSLDTLKNKTLNVFSGIASAGRAAFAAVAIGVAAVATPLIGLGVAGIKASASFEQVNVAFTTLLKSADVAQKVLNDLNKLAADTPLQFADLADGARNLAAFGVSANDIVPTLTRIGDVASGIGAPLGEVTEIYGKMRVQQKLYAEDLNQLTGRGIPVIAEFAKQFGVAESEVKQLASEGKISFANLEQAFISLTSEGGQFFEMMDAQSRTLLGRWSTFTDNFNQLLKRIGDRIIETFDIKTELENATKLLEQWGPRVEATVQRVLDTVKTIVTAIGNSISQFFTVVRNIWDALTFAFTEDTKAMLNDTLGAVGGFIRSAGDLALGVLDLFGTID